MGEPYRHGFQHGDELGHPAYCCPFCHVEGRWYLMREGDAVVTWSCEVHLDWVLDSLQRREPGTTRVSVKKVVRDNQRAVDPPEEQ